MNLKNSLWIIGAAVLAFLFAIPYFLSGEKAANSLNDALIQAIEEEKFQTVKSLVETLTKGHPEAGRLEPELYLTAMEQTQDHLDLLLEMEEDVKAADDTEEVTAWDLSVENTLDIFSFLLDRGPARLLKNPFIFGMWEVAFNHHSLDVLKLLRKKGLDVNAKNKEGATPLMAAIRESDLQMIRWLIDEGADVNAAGVFGTVLMAAVGEGNPEIVRYLIGRGADVNASGVYGSALLTAVDGGNPGIVRLLLENGAQVNPPPSFGITPLEEAKRLGQREILNLLLKGQPAVLPKSQRPKPHRQE